MQGRPMNRLLWAFFALCVAVMQGEEAKLYLQLGHPNRVDSVAISPDGRWVLTGGTDGIALWEVATGQEIRRLEGDAGSMTCVAFSADGRWALTAREVGRASWRESV